MSLRVFITGGTGFIGSHLVSALAERGDSPVVLTRSPEKARERLPGACEIVSGDPTEAGDWQQKLERCDAVANLAGEPVDGQRWDARFRQRIHDSRIDATRYVVEALSQLAPPARPKVLVSASGIDFYPLIHARDFESDDEFTEASPAGSTFMSRVCRDWEREAFEAKALGVRVVTMRTGMVLGRGGALERLKLPFRFFVGGRLGNGKQWTSWIHIDDAVRAYLFAIDHKDVKGPLNLVAPKNARNRDLAAALGAALGRPSWLPAPGFAVKAVAGDLAEHVLKGRKAVPEALQTAGFRFEYPSIDEAMGSLLR